MSILQLFLDFFKTPVPDDWPVLPPPDDSIQFFQAIKKSSEEYWTDTSLANEIYGFQVQPVSIWQDGLSDQSIESFEREIGFPFPNPLKNFYRTMNGLTKQGINIYGSSKTEAAFRPIFYSYPHDLSLIKEIINDVYLENNISIEKNANQEISKIFPITGHRFMLVDIPGNPILSIKGRDIIYYAENLSKLLANQIFDNIWNVYDFESPPSGKPEIKFWLDEVAD